MFHCQSSTTIDEHDIFPYAQTIFDSLDLNQIDKYISTLPIHLRTLCHKTSIRDKNSFSVDD